MKKKPTLLIALLFGSIISTHAQKEKDPPPPPPKPTIVDVQVVKPRVSKPVPPETGQEITKPTPPKSKISHTQKQLPPPPPPPPKKED